MLKINEELKKYSLVPYKYKNVGKVNIIDTNSGSYVIKENIDNSIFDYLKSRNFLYFPKIISDADSTYLITEYITDTNTPYEQRIDDMIDLVSLLHNKTTHFEKVDSSSYKEIYEETLASIENLYNYYNDIMTMIESKVFMSPSEYALAISISKVFERLSYSYDTLATWYKNVASMEKKRIVTIHNNLKMDHLIIGDTPYLISWDKSRTDMPIFDLYNLYKNNDNFDFGEALKRYEKNYKLLDEERMLLFIKISIPDKIIFDKDEIGICEDISKMINKLDNAVSLTK